jgi:hypothetical protein
MVMFEALRGPFAAAGLALEVRGFGMGGVPSFPNSLCMADFLGGDTDLVVWDFRMVEHDEIKGELYIRQAMLMLRRPSVMFKRETRYLPALKKLYGDSAGLHAVDETKLFNALQGNKEVANDKFCKEACTCPGQ